MDKTDEDSSMTNLIIEDISKQVHNDWWATKQGQGVFVRQAEDGEQLMVPYEQLSEKAKNLDRNVVKTVLSALAKLNYKLVLNAPSAHQEIPQ